MKTERHASKLGDTSEPLCGAKVWRLTHPGEIVTCPDCRVILDHMRARYGDSDYVDRRLSQEEQRKFAASMYRDLVLGDIEG